MGSNNSSWETVSCDWLLPPLCANYFPRPLFFKRSEDAKPSFDIFDLSNQPSNCLGVYSFSGGLTMEESGERVRGED